MSNSTTPSAWACERFGDAAAALIRAIPAGLQLAHERALAGHEAMGLSSNTVYGHLWETQHEELIKQVKDIDSVHLIKPAGARYQLASVGPHNTVLYPWRYGDDLRVDIDRAKMRMSDVRRSLLELNPPAPDPQGTIEQATMSEEELLAEFQEMSTLLEEMTTSGRMTLIAYTSNPRSGLLRVYWGEATQADEDGHLRWSHREVLPLTAPPQNSRDFGGTPMRPVPPPDSRGLGGARFDDAPLQEPDLGIRPPLTSPNPDPARPEPETGSDG